MPQGHALGNDPKNRNHEKKGIVQGCLDGRSQLLRLLISAKHKKGVVRSFDVAAITIQSARTLYNNIPAVHFRHKFTMDTLSTLKHETVTGSLWFGSMPVNNKKKLIRCYGMFSLFW